MRELSQDEQKVFRRLRKAYQRGIISAMLRKAPRDELIEICKRISQHAIKLGWLTLPVKKGTT